MIVVADTSPLNYLILIEQIDVLKALYGEIVVPPAVQDEMLDPRAPAQVRSWISNPPSWLEVRTPSRIDASLHPSLDEGEREAIALAQTGGVGTVLLIDERLGRQEAVRVGLTVVGTLGILLLAHQRGLLDMPSAIERLRTARFKASEDLIRKFLDLA